MFEIADRLVAAIDAGRTLVVATAVSIEGSAPRTVGTSMAFDGEAVIGSIAGGCVEGAVVDVCREVLADGVARTVEYGVSDETAFSVGLTCGGQLRIRVVPVTTELETALRGAAAGETSGAATVVDGDATGHEGRIAAELTARVSLGETALSSIDCDGRQVEVFFEVAAAPPPPPRSSATASRSATRDRCSPPRGGSRARRSWCSGPPPGSRRPRPTSAP
jgi:xanthine dehydrogenase accessory factor